LQGVNKMFLRKRGQSAVEYTLLITAIIIALVAIKALAQKAVSGRVKEAAKELGPAFEPDSFYHGYTNKGDGGTVTTHDIVGERGVKKTSVDSTETITSGEQDTWGEYDGGPQTP
jgi:Flp pilus assembly pilin Flp